MKAFKTLLIIALLYTVMTAYSEMKNKNASRSASFAQQKNAVLSTKHTPVLPRTYFIGIFASTCNEAKIINSRKRLYEARIKP